MARGLWELAERQHGVVARRQLLRLGFSSEAIQHRVARGRLHPVRRGVYAVGRPELTEQGRLMAAVLACFPTGALSHQTAAALWGIAPPRAGPPHLTVPRQARNRPPGLVVHRRDLRPQDLTVLRGIPITTPLATMVDIAATLRDPGIEAAINEGDKQDRFVASRLPSLLAGFPPRPGVKALRRVATRHTHHRTDSELERRFLRLIRAARLPEPQTGVYVNGFKTDFFWPGSGVIVETDGLRYHRTAASQAKDRLRDQAHLAAGMKPLRFTHAQIADDPGYVASVVKRVLNPAGPAAPG